MRESTVRRLWYRLVLLAWHVRVCVGCWLFWPPKETPAKIGLIMITLDPIPTCDPSPFSMLPGRAEGDAGPPGTRQSA